ncbi:hypothetical protein FBUS_11286 [Fasciolopsis buskii]|uniref:Uncharacterized protein n=1 Tax=Fasciolopsis buskii TaxID=27845 RepID=A0A8E0RXI4_9TREM|nr:hypothetical protein FBUS_11286 [Fasciolopsis buski]
MASCSCNFIFSREYVAFRLFRSQGTFSDRHIVHIPVCVCLAVHSTTWSLRGQWGTSCSCSLSFW